MSDLPAAYKTSSDLPSWAGESGGQHPGVYPYVRGIHPRMYTSRLWRMRQYAGFGGPAETNERWRLLLSQGQNGVSCAFDLPTQLGYDSDDPKAAHDAGRLGVAIDVLHDFIAMFDGIPLDKVSATFNINATSIVIYAMLLETAAAQGVDPASLTGSISNDPLIEFIARGLWRLPPTGALRTCTDLYEAGGTSVQEIGFGFACAQAYLDQLVARGADLAKAAARVSFLLFGDTNL